MGAGKNIVGRLGIKVTPELDGFRQKLKAGVLKAARGVEAEVEARIDATDLRGQLNRAVRMAEKSVKDAKVGVDLQADRGAWKKQLSALRRMVNDDNPFPTMKYDKDYIIRKAQEALHRQDIRAMAKARKRAYEKYMPDLPAVEMEPDRSFFNKTRTLLDGFFERDYRGKVKFELDEDTDAGWDRLKGKIDKAFLKYENYKFKVNAQVDVETGRVDAALDELRTEFRRRAFEGEDFEIDVKAEMDDGDLREVGRKLKRLKQQWDDTEIEFQLSLDRSDRYVAAARLAWLARDRWVKLKPVVDNRALQVAATTLAALAGGRLVKDMGTNLWDMVKNIDKAVPRFGFFGSMLAGLSAATVQLLKHTVGVAGSLGHILQMVGLLGPGFLVAGGMLASAFVVPMFKAKEYIQDILDDWVEMSDEMGESFWSSAIDDFRAAHERAFKAFGNDMANMSAAAGKHFGLLSDSISRIVAPRFHEWVKHASDGLEVLGSHADAFATVIDVLGRHGSRSLEDFLGWLGRTTDTYANWLMDAEESGKLTMMIDRGVQAMKDLGRATKNLGTTLGGVYEVARKFGGADLGAMADGLGRWSEITHSEPFQKNLGYWFQGMQDAWSNLKAESGKYVKEFLASWSTLMATTGGKMGAAAGKMLAGLSVAFSGFRFNVGFDKFFVGLNDGLDHLVSVWPRVSSGLGELLSFMGSLGRGFAPVIGEVLETAVRVAERLGPTLSRIVESAGPKMAKVLRDSTSVALPFLEVAARLVDRLAKVPGAVEAVTYAFIGFKTLSAAAGIVTALGKAFSGLVPDLTQARKAMKRLTTGFDSLPKSLRGALTSVGTFVSGGLGKLGSAFKTAAAGAVTFVSGGLGRISGGVRGAVASLGVLVSSGFTRVASASRGALAGLAAFVSGGLGGLGRAASAALAGLVGLASSGFSRLATVAASAATGLAGFVTNGLSRVAGAASAAAAGLAGFVTNGLGRVRGAASGAASSLAGLATAGGVVGVALAAVGVAVGIFASRDAAKVRRANEDLVRSFNDAADGVTGAADRMRSALENLAGTDMYGFQMNVGNVLNTSMDLLSQGKWGQFGARFFTNSKAMGVADSINDAFAEIGKIAERNSAGAAVALRDLGEAFKASGGDSAAFTAELNRQMSEIPALGSSLQNLASYIGYAGDSAGVAKMLASGLNIEWQKGQVDAARLVETTSSLTAALDSVAGGYAGAYDQTVSMVDMVREMGSAFIDFGAAATNSSGEAISSIGEVAANLEVQVQAYSDWADNVQSLMERGVSEGVIRELSKLPNGAQLVADFAAKSGAEFGGLKDSFNSSFAAMSGGLEGMSEGIRSAAAVADVSFAEMKAAVETALGELPGTANIAGAETVDQLAAALSEGGYSIQQAGEGFALVFENGIDEMKSTGLRIGTETAENVAAGLASVDLETPADATMKQFGDRYKMGAQEATAGWVSELTTGIAAAASSVDMTVAGVTAGFTAALRQGMSPETSSQVGTGWVSALAAGVMGAAGEATTAGKGVAKSILDGARSGLEGGAELGGTFGLSLVNGFRLGVAGLQATVTGVTSAAVTAAGAGREGMVAAGNALAVGIATGFKSGGPMFLAGVTSVLAAARAAGIAAAGGFTAVGLLIAAKVAGGLRGAQGQIRSAASGAVGAAISAGRAAAGGATGIGVYIGAGIAAGIQSQVGRIAAAAAGAVRAAISAANAAGDIRSPSRKTYWTGQMLGLGAEKGIWSSVPGIEDAASGIVVALLASLKSGSERAERLVSDVLEPVAVGVSSRSVSLDSSGSAQMVLVDPRSFEGASFPLRVGEREFTGFVEDVSAGVVEDYDDARYR